MSSKPTVIVITAIICITLLTAFAIHTRSDSTTLLEALIAIAGLGGYILSRR